MATIQGKFVNDSGSTVFEGSFVTDGAFDVTTPDVGPTETAENITIQPGSSATPGSGAGGSVTIQPGDGDTAGEVHINDGAGDIQIQVNDAGDVTVGVVGDATLGNALGAVSFYGVTPHTKISVADIANPAAATAEDVANALNALLTALGSGAGGVGLLTIT